MYQAIYNFHPSLSQEDQTIYSYMTDLHQFVSSSYDTLSHSTTRLYISVLAWLPEDPLRPMLSCMKSDSLICTGRSKDWPSMLWVATLGGIVRQTVF